MYPIYLFDNNKKGNIGSNADDFFKEFMNICEMDKANKTARVFAFILTDFSTAGVNSFILNNDFWNELHIKSDSYLTIFHFDFTKESLNELFKKNQVNYVKEQYNVFYTRLGKLFETDDFDKLKMPSVLFFQTSESKILDFFCLELDNEDSEKIIEDLKSYIGAAAMSVSKVTDDNLNNSMEIYNLLKSSIEGTKFRKGLVNVIKKFIRIYDLFG